MMDDYVSDENLGRPALSEVLAAASEIDGVDIALALDRIGGKQEVLEAALEQTVNSMGEKLRRMGECLSSKDLRTFSIEAHGLKNAFASIGATKQSELASELETESKNGNELICEVKFPYFVDFSMSFAEQLKAVLPRDDLMEKRNGDRELLVQVISEAIHCLSSFEADDALSSMSKLEGYTYGEEIDALLAYIKNRIKSFKYNEAALLLKSLTM